MVTANHFIKSEIKFKKHSKKNVTHLDIFFPQLIHSSFSTKDQGDNNKNIHTIKLAFKRINITH